METSKEILYYGFSDFEKDIYDIKKDLSSKIFDAVLAPSRGGLLLGVRLSHEFHIPFGIIEYQTRDVVQEAPELNLPKIAINPGIGLEKMESILVVDDIADSGKTFTELEKFFSTNYPNLKVIYYSLYGRIREEENDWKYCHEMIHDWIVFTPWESSNKDFCSNCWNGETCNKDIRMIHCNLYDRSFQPFHTCRIHTKS